MHTGTWRRLGSNAVANVFAGASVVVIQLALTAIAARSFDAQGFAAWTVLISLAAMCPLFAASLSIIVTRCLVSNQGSAESAAVMFAARRLGWQLSVLSWFSLSALALLLFPFSTPLSHLSWAQVLLVAVILVSGQLWQISLQPAIGWHYAKEQNWAAAGATAAIRIGSLVAMLLAWKIFPNDLFITALSIATGSWLAMAAVSSSGFSPKRVPDVDAAVLRKQTGELHDLSKAFAVWSVGAAAIQYGLPAIMSVMAAGGYNAFYLAYTLNLVIIGVLGAASGALLAPVTRHVVAKNVSILKNWLYFAPALTGLMLLVSLLILYHSIAIILRHWTPGIATASMVSGYLYLLGFQTIARSLSVIFAVVLSSTGKPKQVVAPILMEIGLATLLALPIGFFMGDRTFLLALAAAGLATSLLTAHVTVKLVISSAQSRRRIQAAFVLVQLVTLGCWSLVGMNSA